MTAASLDAMLEMWLAGSGVAGLTWFFSSRPRLHIRVFVTRDEWRGGVWPFVRDPEFGRGMRAMAILQFLAASLFGPAWLWLQFASGAS